MPLNFQPRSGSSFDPISGITIPEPRILPARLPDGSAGTEYQYAFYLNHVAIGRLGFCGSDYIAEANGARERVFEFDLGHDWLIKSMLEFKRKIADSDDDMGFLRSLANGLVMAYAGQTDNDENLRYVAITTPDALVHAGVLVSDEGGTSSEGMCVLAEVSIPAHTH